MTNHNDEQTQAAKLKELFEEVTREEQIDDNNELDKNENSLPEIDILNLPPRSEVHQSKSRKLKLTFQRPLIRLLLVIILLIAIAFGAFYFVGDEYFVFSILAH